MVYYNNMDKKEENKKGGMQEGYLVYSSYMNLFLNELDLDYKTTNDIMQGIIEKIGSDMRPMSWNTVNKYLHILESEGKVEGRRVGKYNLWRKVGVKGLGKDARNGS